MSDPIGRAEAAAQACRDAARDAHEATKDLRQLLAQVRDERRAAADLVTAKAEALVAAALETAIADARLGLPEAAAAAVAAFVDRTMPRLERALIDNAADRVRKDMHEVVEDATRQQLTEMLDGMPEQLRQVAREVAVAHFEGFDTDVSLAMVDPGVASKLKRRH